MNLEEVDADTWVFRADDFFMDAPQKAKSKVYDENDVSYNRLRAKIIDLWGKKWVVVVNMAREDHA